jgi:hypothetical protein
MDCLRGGDSEETISNALFSVIFGLDPRMTERGALHVV